MMFISFKYAYNSYKESDVLFGKVKIQKTEISMLKNVKA